MIIGGICKVFHEQKGLIMETSMGSNCMFIMNAEEKPTERSSCLQTSTQSVANLWHKRFGHLSDKGMEILKKEEMVVGLTEIESSIKTCEQSLKGKQ